MSKVPCAIMEPSLTDGVPIYDCPDDGRYPPGTFADQATRYPHYRLNGQATLRLGDYGNYLDLATDMEGLLNGE